MKKNLLPLTLITLITLLIALLLAACTLPTTNEAVNDYQRIENRLVEEQLNLQNLINVALPDGRMMDMGDMSGDMSCCKKDMNGMMNCCSCCKMMCMNPDNTSDAMSCCKKDGDMGGMGGCGSHDATDDMSDMDTMASRMGDMGDMTGDMGHKCKCCEGMTKQFGYIKKIVIGKKISFYIFLPVVVENNIITVNKPEILFNKEGISEGFDDYDCLYVKVKGKDATGKITGLGDITIEGLYGHCVKEQTPPWKQQ